MLFRQDVLCQLFHQHRRKICFKGRGYKRHRENQDEHESVPAKPMDRRFRKAAFDKKLADEPHRKSDGASPHDQVSRDQQNILREHGDKRQEKAVDSHLIDQKADCKSDDDPF